MSENQLAGTETAPTQVTPAETRSARRVVCGPYGIVIEDAGSLEDVVSVVERRYPNDDPSSHRRIVETLLAASPHPLSVMFHSLTENTLPDEPALPVILRSTDRELEVLAEEVAVDGRTAGAVRWYRFADIVALRSGERAAWRISVGGHEAELPREWIDALVSVEG